MSRIEKRIKFLLAGTTHEHANPAPEMAAGSVNRFTYGEEPKVIAQVPLAGGGTAEIHGYATFYTQDWVTVEWTDDNFQHFNCWTPAADVRRPADGEWHGKFVSR